MKSIRAVLAAAALVVPSVALAATWEIDPSHSSAAFTIRHLMVSNVHGQFSNVKGLVKVDDKDMTKSSVDATVDATSINTADAKRDEHLKSADFLDTAKFPTFSFKSTKVEKAGTGLKVTGDLTLHGVTKPVVLAVEGPSQQIKDPWGNTRVGATATTTVNRKDFGLTWNKAMEAGGVMVGDEVKITLELEMTRKDAAPAAPAKGSSK
jgi:polyisoprenoid-binding protein YceI